MLGWRGGSQGSRAAFLSPASSWMRPRPCLGDSLPPSVMLWGTPRGSSSWCSSVSHILLLSAEGLLQGQAEAGVVFQFSVEGRPQLLV